MIYQAVSILLAINIRFKNSMLKSNFCDYSNTYVVVKGAINVEGDDHNKKKIKTYPL